MSIAEGTVGSTPARATGVANSRDIAVHYRWQVYLACVGLALVCNYVLGKDMAWDTLNYHLYLGFSSMNDRFNQDYFAAGTLSYLNPYAYAPFYVMVHAGLPALAICSIFAIVHSVILWLSFELGMAVCPSMNDRTRVFAGSCAVGLALMNPILMQQIGSCFADITTAELALGGWLLLAGAVRAPALWRVICAGLILGAASALKLSNALAAIAAFGMIAMVPLNWRGKIRQGILYSLSLAVAFAGVAAPWSYRLAQVFGNPMFPMFNTVFRSPEFTTESAGTPHRFIPDSVGQALWRPFAMIDPAPMIHEELNAPDVRYAVLLTLVFLFVIRWFWRHRAREASVRHNPPMNESARVLTALGLSLALYWTLWLRVSGNGRYVLTMSCVAAGVMVGVLFQLCDSRPKARNYILAAIFIVQAMQLYMGTEYRWNGVPWGGQWFDVSLPKKLGTDPNLYLTLGDQSNSFLAAFLAKGSGLVNLTGVYTLDPESENGARVRALIDKFSPNVRVVFPTSKPVEGTKPPPVVRQVNSALQWFGVRADVNDCATIAVHGLPPALEIRSSISLPEEPQNRDTTYVGTCRVVSDSTDMSVLNARRHAVNLVFDRLEDACPSLFQPRRAITVNDGDSWQRVYGVTDTLAWVSHGRVRVNQIRPNGVLDLGSESDWAKAPLRLECGRRNGVYFAHVL